MFCINLLRIQQVVLTMAVLESILTEKDLAVQNQTLSVWQPDLIVPIPFLLLCVSTFLVPSLPGILKVTVELGSFNF